MKVNTYTKTYPKRHSTGEVHSNTGLHKEERKISNKWPEPASTRTRETTKNKAMRKQKEGNNQDQSTIKWHRDYKKKKKGRKEIQSDNASRSYFFEKVNKIDKLLTDSARKKERGLKYIKLDIKQEN